LNSIFSKRDFWRLFFTLESDELDKAAIQSQLDELRNDFTVRNDEIHYTYGRKKHTMIEQIVEFHFACGEHYSLLLEYSPKAGGCDKNLSLVDLRTDLRSSLGWWDLARWHPYCIRPEELDTLLAYWGRHDPRWRTPELPLLLLCPFVGFADQPSCDAYQARVSKAYHSLGVPLADDSDLKGAVFRYDDYTWNYDNELGWVYESKDYGCYSIRNREHAGSNAGDFPFASLRDMLSDVHGAL
jgi:hypothetical protein